MTFERIWMILGSMAIGWFAGQLFVHGIIWLLGIPIRRKAKREEQRAEMRRRLGISKWKCECGMHLRFSERRCPNGCTSSVAVENESGSVSWIASHGGGA